MKYLLDTNVFLWSIGPVKNLNSEAQRLLGKVGEHFYLSAASAWEIAIKSGIGKLQLPEPVGRLIPNALQLYGIRPLPITHLHAMSVAGLPAHHQDPFDRMLISQAIIEDMILMTSDHMFSKYPVQTMWCGR